MSENAVSSLRSALAAGGAGYDEVQAVTALLNRRAVRQPPAAVLEFLASALRAVAEGCTVAALRDADATHSAEHAPASGGGEGQRLAKHAGDAASALLRTWLSIALPLFVAGCATAPELPEHVAAVLSALDVSALPAAARARVGVPLALARYRFASKLEHESATKSLSDATLRRARFFAQVAAADSYLVAAASASVPPSPGASTTTAPAAATAATPSPGADESLHETEAAPSLGMALSALMWVSDVLWRQSAAASSLAAAAAAAAAATASSAPQLPASFDAEALWLHSAKQCLRLLAQQVSTTGSRMGGLRPSPAADEFTSLPPREQARCLVQLAWRGLSRATPVSVLYRRFRALALSTAHPEFLFLTCVGLLSEAPPTASRDRAVRQLVHVYFTAQPSAPLAADTALRDEFDAFARECLFMRAGATEAGASASNALE